MRISPEISVFKSTLRAFVRALSKLPAIGVLVYFTRDRLIEKQHGTYFFFNVASWKTGFLAEYATRLGAPRVKFVVRQGDSAVYRNAFCGQRDPQIIVWGAEIPPLLSKYAARMGWEIWHLEDGFLRSKGLGAAHIAPHSLILDRSGSIYYRYDKASKIEQFLQTHEFSEEERVYAAELIAIITKGQITKYNLSDSQAAIEIDRSRRNILVFGQCEDDQSIKYGSPIIKTNLELLRQVQRDYPDANIFYRPHPDVTAGLRRPGSDVSTLAPEVTILDGRLSVWRHIDKFDVVCVITSLAGFEALLRGVVVHTYGVPFYAGWGATKDHITCGQRSKSAFVEEIFYAAYVHAPDYFEPSTGATCSIEETLRSLAR